MSKYNWYVSGYDDINMGNVRTSENTVITYDIPLDVARYIVNAVNAHDDLLAALNVASKYLGKIVADGLMTNCAVPPEKALKMIMDAIAKAEGRQP